MNTGVAANKQYIVTDNRGQILVNNKIASAFEASGGDYNKFLEKVGGLTQVSKTTVSQQDVHEAWDRYFVAVGKGVNSDEDITEHILGFNYNIDKEVGFCTYNTGYLKNNYAPGAENEKLYLSIQGDNYYINTYKVEALAYFNESTGETDYKFGYRTQALHGDDKFVDLQELTKEDESGTTKIFPGKFSVGADGTVFYNDGTYDSEGNYTPGSRDFACYYIDPTVDPSTEPTDIFIEDSADYYRLVCSASSPDSLVAEINETTIFYDGTTAEHRKLYDYAVAVSRQWAAANINPDGSVLQKELTYDAGMITYYRNIYDQIITKGYTTYKEMLDKNYMVADESDEKVAYQDENWLITQLKRGKLNISYYSATEKEFISTTLDDDESITEKEDKAKIKLAEQAYNSSMDRIEICKRYSYCSRVYKTPGDSCDRS